MKNSKAKLQETMKRNEEKIQKCAHELLASIDSISKYKESMLSTISQIKNQVLETTLAITHIHKASLTTSNTPIYEN